MKDNTIFQPILQTRHIGALSILLVCVALTLSAKPMREQKGMKPFGPPWHAPGSFSSKKNPLSGDRSSIKKGKKLYKAACVACHGTRGNGHGPAAIALPIHAGDFTDSKFMRAQSDGSVFWKISEGRGTMPPFKAAFNETDRWNLVNYIRTLAR